MENGDQRKASGDARRSGRAAVADLDVAAGGIAALDAAGDAMPIAHKLDEAETITCRRSAVVYVALAAQNRPAAQERRSTSRRAASRRKLGGGGRSDPTDRYGGWPGGSGSGGVLRGVAPGGGRAFGVGLSPLELEMDRQVETAPGLVHRASVNALTPCKRWPQLLLRVWRIGSTDPIHGIGSPSEKRGTTANASPAGHLLAGPPRRRSGAAFRARAASGGTASLAAYQRRVASAACPSR